MRIVTFLFILIVCYRCRSMGGTLTERCRSHNSIVSYFAGATNINIGCLGFVPSSWCLLSANGTQTELDVDAIDALVQDSLQVLRITTLSADYEGEYKCRRDENSDFVTAQCVFVIGRAVRACQHFGNCRENIEATEGAIATFDANIIFLEGGEVNQPLLTLIVRKNSVRNNLYTCDLRREECDERDRFQVVRHKGRTTQNITVMLKNLTTADAGNFEIVVESLNPNNVFTTDENSIIPINIHYQLQVSEAPTTELSPTTTSLPEYTTLVTGEPSETSDEPSTTAETSDLSTTTAAATTTSSTDPNSMEFIIGVTVTVAVALIAVIVVAVLTLIYCYKTRPISSKTVLGCTHNHVDKSHTVFEDSLIVPHSNPAAVIIPHLMETGSGLRPQGSSGSISNNSSSSNSRPSNTETSSDQNLIREQTRNTHISETPHRGSAIDFAGDLSAKYFSEAVRL